MVDTAAVLELAKAMRAEGVQRVRLDEHGRPVEMELFTAAPAEKGAPAQQLTPEQLSAAARKRELDTEWGHIPGGAPPWVRRAAEIEAGKPMGDPE